MDQGGFAGHGWPRGRYKTRPARAPTGPGRPFSSERERPDRSCCMAEATARLVVRAKEVNRRSGSPRPHEWNPQGQSFVPESPQARRAQPWPFFFLATFLATFFLAAFFLAMYMAP